MTLSYLLELQGDLQDASLDWLYAPAATQTPSRVSDILAGLRSPGPGRTPGGVFRSPQLGASTQSQVGSPELMLLLTPVKSCA